MYLLLQWKASVNFLKPWKYLPRRWEYQRQSFPTPTNAISRRRFNNSVIKFERLFACSKVRLSGQTGSNSMSAFSRRQLGKTCSKKIPLWFSGITVLKGELISPTWRPKTYFNCRDRHHTSPHLVKRVKFQTFANWVVWVGIFLGNNSKIPVPRPCTRALSRTSQE